MNSDEPLTRIAIESLRAIARSPLRETSPPSTPADRLELLNAILLRDQDAAAGRVANRRSLTRQRTKL